jgi:hypothetical protein
MRISIGVLLLTNSSYAHEVSQRVVGYSDNVGESRQLYQLEGILEPLPSQQLALSANVESVRRDDQDDVYMQDHFPEGRREKRGVSGFAKQTWFKLNETREQAAWQSDGVTTTKSYSFGVSRWVFQETLQLGVDGTRYETDRPESSILDYDGEQVVMGPQVTSNVFAVSSKWLATSTTIILAEYDRVYTDERPPLYGYKLGVRQFIPSWEAAVHSSVTRVINLGDLSKESNDGELSGWAADIAFLKTLWKEAYARVGYRFYREDEFTRAYGDHQVFASDSASCGFVTPVPLLDSKKQIRLSANYTRYISNNAVNAQVGELGLTSVF